MRYWCHRLMGMGMMYTMVSLPSSPLRYQSLEDLLEKQRKGKFLTFEEKKYLKQYAEEQRQKNLKKKMQKRKN